LRLPHLPNGRMLIVGQWVEALGGERIKVLDPATERTIGSVARGQSADIDLAVRAARNALSNASWSKMSALDRERLLTRLANLIEENADELARIEALDNGKAVTIARNIDVVGAINTFRYFAGWPSKMSGLTLPVSSSSENYHAYTIRQPIGVVGQIIPWNYPLVMAAWKLAPALASGCTVVLKPAEQTPYTALRLGELVQEAGFPPGVVNIVTGFGFEAGDALVHHPRVSKIAFTGSTSVGKHIAASAAKTLKRVTLELGGKSPTIILPDADLDVATPTATQACFFNSGQLCFAGTRLFAPRNLFNRVLEGVSSAVTQMKVGPGLDVDTVLGPVVSEVQMERVLDKIARGRNAGASIEVGGSRRGNVGYFVEPTIAVTTDVMNPLYREEVFGPVLAAIPYDDIDDLIRLANDTEYGLGANVFTRDVSAAHTLARGIEAGTIWVNCALVADPALPFGGFKQSGYGRENSGAVLDHYSELKTVCVKL
jgi:phenylacetaldehyde dehydrogenase